MVMKQKYIEYPTFTSGEVLSKELLDNLVGYDDEQARLTRCKLIGAGIVEGLDYSFDDREGILTIHPGTAVTNVGNMVCINSPARYYLYHKTVALSLQDSYVFSRDGFLDLPRAFKLPSGLVLALKYEKKPVSSDVCSQNSCDMVHVRTEITISPVVYPKDGVEKAFIFPKLLSDRVDGRSFNDVLACLNTKVLHKNVKEICLYRAKGIMDVMNAVDKMMDSVEDNPFPFIFDKYLAKERQWKNARKRMEQIEYLGLLTKKSAGDTPQYYLNFLEDVREALKEFLDVYNKFVREHSRLGHRYYVMDDVVMLGCFGESPLDRDPFRNYFEPALEDPAFRREAALVGRHLTRVAVMVEQFIGTSVQWNDIPCALIPVDPHAKLGERPIPFYYHLKGTQLLRVWDPYTCGTPAGQSCFAQIKCQSFETFASSYQLSGYYNKRAIDVVARLETIIDTYGLPLKVKKLDMFEGAFHSSQGAVRCVEKLRTVLQGIDSGSDAFISRVAKAIPDAKVQKQVRALVVQLGNSSFINRCLQNDTASIMCLMEAKTYLSGVSADQLLACITDDDIAKALDKSGDSVSSLRDDFRSAYSRFVQHVNNATKSLKEATFAKTRYVERNDTIYVCAFKGKSIFYFSAPSLE